MPAFNASKSILYAISSILAQTYQNWECIIVDDGSTDNTSAIVDLVTDNRIRLIKLNKNLGRGGARQICLNNAKGKYISMLDADDWIYPDKLKNQVQLLEENPNIALCSCGMSIVDSDNKMVATRKLAKTIHKDYETLEKLICPHAPSVIRQTAISGVGYDRRFRLGQDVDFLRRVLYGKSYIVTTDVFYVYTEMNSVSLTKILLGYAYNGLGYIKFIKANPMRSLVLSTAEFIKIPIQLISFILKGKEGIILNRSKSTNSDDVIKHNSAREKVDSTFKLLREE